MCGIVGMLRWDGLQPEDHGRIRRATETLRHRGPDGQGFWADSHCALGFRRLRVIDRTSAGDQPLGNEDGSVQVVFNGEIYNYRQLRDDLESRGHLVRSRTDSEVLVHGYEEWDGRPLLDRLRGMFAFAIWDTGKRRLFLARDPMGVKPLYFAERDGVFCFASEPKAIFATQLLKPEIDPFAVHEALTYRYVPPPRSGFRDVEKLPPGHYALAENGHVQYQSWWKLEDRKAEMSAKQLGTEALHARLKDAVQSRLIADVPLGAWLSGGIDSGLVAAHLPEPQERPTFCAGFAQQEYDERHLAARTADHLGTQHHDFEIPADLFRLLPQIVWHADEPFFDSSSLPTFILSEQTRNHVTVALSGDGGDEAFAGYERYLGMQWLSKWRGTPGWMRKGMLGIAKFTNPAPSRQGWDRMVRWLEKCRALEGNGFHPYLGALMLFDQEQLFDLYGERMAEELAEVDGREYLSNILRRHSLRAYPDLQPRTFPLDLDILQRADLEAYLPGDVLHKVDRMSMAHGLEVRSPFLDVDLISWALSLPEEGRLQPRRTKPLLRDLAQTLLPKEVTDARKRGFGVPLDDWFRGPLLETAAEVFETSCLVTDGLFRKRYWQNLWNEHQEGRGQHGERLYALLSLECWYRMFIAGEMPEERPMPW